MPDGGAALLAALHAAADGVFPPEDGAARVLPGPGRGLRAVVSFSAHALVCTDAPAALAGLPLDGYGAALAPPALLALADGDGAAVGTLDALLVARGVPDAPGLPVRQDLDGHPRVRYARALRDDVRVFGDDRGLVTLGRGLAGRLELSVERLDAGAPQGSGRALLRDALGLVPAGRPVFAAVAPGNARSLRAFLAAGYVPLGSEVIVRA